VEHELVKNLAELERKKRGHGGSAKADVSSSRPQGKKHVASKATQHL
jgi:hypothetical protein